MSLIFENEAVCAEVFRFLALALARSKDRALASPFVSLARTCTACRQVATAATRKGAVATRVDHGTASLEKTAGSEKPVPCVAWRGAIDLELLGEYLQVTRDATIVGGGLALTEPQLRRATTFSTPGQLLVGRWVFAGEDLREFWELRGAGREFVYSSGVTSPQGMHIRLQIGSGENDSFYISPHDFRACKDAPGGTSWRVTAQVIEPLSRDGLFHDGLVAREFSVECGGFQDINEFDWALLQRHVHAGNDLVVTALIAVESLGSWEVPIRWRDVAADYRYEAE